MKSVKLAIVGRPNVGKSALFNKICKRNIAIVDENEGVTRDRLYGTAYFFERPFEVIDTAGIDPYTKQIFNEEILLQSKIAIEEADSVVMVVDSKIGITKLDEEVAKILFKAQKPVILAVNKIDNIENIGLKDNFHSLGIKEIVPISALSGFNVDDLLYKAFKDIKWPPLEDDNKEDVAKIAVIGRTNVGKSTLLNALLNEKRSVVSDMPATTRDSIDVEIIRDKKKYIFIDTAGIRRKKKEDFVVEKFARIRTDKTIKRCDIAVLIADAQEGFTTQEKKIISQVQYEGKGLIVLVNKWDLIKNYRMEHLRKALIEKNSFLKNHPIIFISAKEKRNIDKIFDNISIILENQNRKISTGALNKFIEQCLQKYHPPMISGKRLRIYYLTQKSVSPHKFILFVNNRLFLTRPYQKYLVNNLRKAFDLYGSCIFFEIRDKKLDSVS